MAPLRPEFPALMNRLAGTISREVLEDIHSCSLKRRTGVSLSQMMSFRPQLWLINKQSAAERHSPSTASSSRSGQSGAGEMGAAEASSSSSEARESDSSASSRPSTSSPSSSSFSSSSSPSSYSSAPHKGMSPLVQSARFLHSELPTRFAHRIAELDHLPHGLSDMPHVLEVRDWYVQSFVALRSFPEVRTEADEEEFTALISRIKAKHSPTLPYIAQGIAELKSHMEVTKPGLPVEEFPEVHHFLDRFFMSRIGIRMLIGQHVALHRQMEGVRRGQDGKRSTMIGLIDTKCSPVEVAHRAIAEARALCEGTYGAAPQVQVYGDPNLTFPYVPRHLHEMLTELLKNSLRAVHERVSSQPDGSPPTPVAITSSPYAPPSLASGKRPLIRVVVADGIEDVTIKSSPLRPLIRVVVADGIEDVTIKVSDEGGGFKRSGLPRIWSYLYSTASTPLLADFPLPQHPILPEQALPAVASPRGDALGVPATRAGGRKPAAPGVPPFLPFASARQQTGGRVSLRQGSTSATPPTHQGAHPGERGGAGGAEAGRREAERGEEEESEEEHVEVRRGGGQGEGQPARHVLAGYGYGLPISRLYARYFGGDLQIFSMEGYGTDAYLHLNRLRNVQEPLP